MIQRILSVSDICARCDGRTTTTFDAIGRPRQRCGRCDGVSKIRPHPDEVLIPQGLVRATTSLPPVAPGQLRCQRCAKGVQRYERFCEDCRGRRRGPDRLPRRYQAKPCANCGTQFAPTGPRALFCEGCR